MTIQGVRDAGSAPAAVLAAPAARRPEASGALPSALTADPPATGALAARIARALAGRPGPAPHLLASEAVTALLVDLPPAPARSRAALLAFAVEERVGVPIDQVVVAPGPTPRLALVVARTALAEAPAGAPVLPDFLGIARPDGTAEAPAWAVWRDGPRAVVRRWDGTGFAVAAEALPALWARAGRPALLRLGAALPPGLPATDLSADPPPPDPGDLGFSFRAQATADAGAERSLVAAGLVALAALALHLGLAAADVLALGRIAAAERARAEAALAPVLPGVALGGDPAPILARLAPEAPAARRGAFLPLLAQASEAVAATGRPVTFRRIAWGAESGALTLLVQGTALDDLQAVEAALRGAGLAVEGGAASAGDGGAEVELRVSQGAAG